MAKKRKVIITCALTGSIHTPSMSPYLPANADAIGQAGLEAAEAAAAILHLHARTEDEGRPTQDPEAFRPFMEKLNANTDAVLNITTGGSPAMTVEDRMRPCMEFAPEVASLNLGSMNFGMFPMLARYSEFKHAWEPEYLENSKDLVFKNTFKDIETILTRGTANGTKFEFECYDISHLYTLKHFVDRGLAQAPLLIQSVFGILGGIGTHPEDLMHMKRTADRLFGDSYEWSILGAGRRQVPLATMGCTMGAHVRCGLEDSLFTTDGSLAESSAVQVRKLRTIVEELGHEIATPDEAREILQLKGRDKVNI